MAEEKESVKKAVVKKAVVKKAVAKKAVVKKAVAKKAVAKKAVAKKVPVVMEEVVSPAINAPQVYAPNRIPLHSNLEKECCDKDCCEKPRQSDWSNSRHSHLVLFLVAVFALLFGLALGSAASMNSSEHRCHYGYYNTQQLQDGGQIMPLYSNGQMTGLVDFCMESNQNQGYTFQMPMMDNGQIKSQNTNILP